MLALPVSIACQNKQRTGGSPRTPCLVPENWIWVISVLAESLAPPASFQANFLLLWHYHKNANWGGKCEWFNGEEGKKTLHY